MALGQPARLIGIESVEEHQGRPGEHGQGEVPDQPGDVEQRGQAEDCVLITEVEPPLVDRGREDNVAVGVGGSLGGAGGARGVDHQCDVVAGEFQRRRHLVPVSSQQVQQANAAGARARLDPAE